MKQKIEKIVSEWFFRLPSGAAIPPYTNEEIDVLKDVLQEYGFKNYPAILQYISEKEKIGSELNLDGEDDPKSDKEPEDHESNADFRNLLDSYQNFNDIVNKRYVTVGLDIGDLNPLYEKLLSYPDSIQAHLRRIIGKKTNRDIYNGTTQFGQYEKMLYDILKEPNMSGNTTADILIMAFIYDGKIKGANVGNQIADGNLIIDGKLVLVDNFRNKAISFGTLPAEVASLFTILKKLAEVIDGVKITDFSKQTINDLLIKISDEGNKQELEQFLTLSNTTKLSALKALSSDIKTALENQNLSELPVKFCSAIDSYLTSVLTKLEYFVDIKNNDMVYMVKGMDLFPSLNCTKEYRLGGGIFKLDEMVLYVDGNVIDEKLA